jgi:hypothetical protein
LEGKFKSKNYGELSDRDKRYMKEHGLSEEEFKTYSRLLKDVRIYVDAFRRRFERFLPKEEEGWQSSVKSKLLNLPNLLGGGTNLEKAILQGSEELELFCKKNHLRGVLIAFSVIPQVPAFVMENYAKKGMKVFDPFAGFGTVGYTVKVYGLECSKNNALEAGER